MFFVCQIRFKYRVTFSEGPKTTNNEVKLLMLQCEFSLKYEVGEGHL